ncbi:ras-related protein Rab-7L1-like [Denticeps clupeoides]|uniref:Ras-related protein Rab n=1 Tax=Denticeps clupeoides TaxID=299321 RepID=A0A8C4BQJ8_9TELE|nr:ras-related protein Rab-7L1-like [Denticeps clupeoides]
MQCREHLFKILVIGDGKVGKTSIVNRYANDKFSKDYRMTVGVDFTMKVVQWSDTDTVRLQLWDIAGQERFISMTRIYYKEASGCVVAFDVTNFNSFCSCINWKKDLDSKAMLPSGALVPCILLANKCDLTDWAVTKERIEQFSQEHGFIGWMETSAKDNKNISESVRYLVDHIMMSHSKDSWPQEKKEDCVNLERTVPENNEQGCC